VSRTPPLNQQDPQERRLQQHAVAELVRVAPVIEELGARFASAGHEIALVGGSVRDALIGHLGDDLDFATSARPDQVADLLRGWADAQWDVGIAFGTIGAQRGEFRLEITTYRAESYDSSSRKPDVEYGHSLLDDLSRRDFTVNAMAITLPAKQFIDVHQGMDDLAARLLRTPGLAQTSFSDDPLRMVRAARFAAQLHFVVAPDVRAAMAEMAARLEIVSAERINAELTKLLMGENPGAGLSLLVDTGLADYVVPEVPALQLEIDEHHRHKDVYEHSLTVLEQAIDLEPRYVGEPDLVLRLAALLHDIGKPRTRRFEAGGGVSFHHHETVGASMVRKRLRALHYPKHVVEDVSTLVELHLRFHGYGDGAWTDSAVRRYVRDAGPLLSRLHALTRADCTTRNKAKATRLARAYDDLEARIAALAEAEELAAIRPDLDGNEIMAVLDLAPGPLVGAAYRYLLEVRLERGPLPHDEVVDELVRWYQEQL
jgi:poly(A) polymerase